MLRHINGIILPHENRELHRNYKSQHSLQINWFSTEHAQMFGRSMGFGSWGVMLGCGWDVMVGCPLDYCCYPHNKLTKSVQISWFPAIPETNSTLQSLWINQKGQLIQLVYALSCLLPKSWEDFVASWVVVSPVPVKKLGHPCTRIMWGLSNLK